MPLGVAAERFVTGDVLVHTWDLGEGHRPEHASIDADFAAAHVRGDAPDGRPCSARAATSDPRIEVPADADPVTKLIAFTGRTP